MSLAGCLVWIVAWWWRVRQSVGEDGHIISRTVRDSVDAARRARAAPQPQPPAAAAKAKPLRCTGKFNPGRRALR